MKAVFLILCVLVAAASAATCDSAVDVNTVTCIKADLKATCTVDFAGINVQFGNLYCKERKAADTAATVAALKATTAIVISNKTKYAWIKTLTAVAYKLDCVGDKANDTVASSASFTPTAAATPAASATTVTVKTVTMTYDNTSATNQQKYLVATVTANFDKSSGKVWCAMSASALTEATIKSNASVKKDEAIKDATNKVFLITVTAGTAVKAYCVGDGVPTTVKASSAVTATANTTTTITGVPTSVVLTKTANFAEVSVKVTFANVVKSGSVTCSLMDAAATTWAKINVTGKMTKAFTTTDNLLYSSHTFTFKSVATGKNQFAACAGADQAGKASTSINWDALVTKPVVASVTMTNLITICVSGNTKSQFDTATATNSQASVTFAKFTSGDTICAISETALADLAAIKKVTGKLTATMKATTSKSAKSAIAFCPLGAAKTYKMYCAGDWTGATVAKSSDFYSKAAFACPTQAKFVYSGSTPSVEVTPTVDGTTTLTLTADKDVFAAVGATKITISDANCKATGNASSTKKLVVTVSSATGKTCALTKTAFTLTAQDNLKTLNTGDKVSFTAYTNKDAAEVKAEWTVEATKTGSACTTVPTLAALVLGAVVAMFQL